MLQSPLGTCLLLIQVTSQIFNRTHIHRTRLFQLGHVFQGPLILFLKLKAWINMLFNQFHIIVNFVDYCTVVSFNLSVHLMLMGVFCTNFRWYIFFSKCFMLLWLFSFQNFWFLNIISSSLFHTTRWWSTVVHCSRHCAASYVACNIFFLRVMTLFIWILWLPCCRSGVGVSSAEGWQ